MSHRHFMLLVEISDQLSERDLRDLVFCCGNVVSEATAENIASGVDLFRTLKHQNCLGPGRYDYLKKCLAAIGRVDLSNKLPSKLKSVLQELSPRLKEPLAVVALSHSSPLSPEDCHTFSSRAQLLRVAADLTTEDVSKLVYLFADRLPNPSLERMDAVELLLQLEAAGALRPDRPKLLVTVLKAIGRRDLAAALLSTGIPQFVQSGLGASHQLLHMKMSMLAGQQSVYSRQRKLLSAIAESDEVAFAEHILKPAVQNLDGSLYPTISRLCTGTLNDIERTGNLDELLRSTLPAVFEFMESYLSTIYHYVTCEGGCVSIDAVQSLSETCRKSYSKFEREISHFQWNAILRSNIQSDLTQRRTPIGSPALSAVSSIYELCVELSSHPTALRVSMGESESNIHALDYLHHSYRCGVVMTQWLESLLCLLACTSDEPGASIPYDPQILRSALLRIAAEYQVQICSTYSRIEGVMGAGILQRVAERLHEDGVSISNQESVNHKDGMATLKHTRLGWCESSIYVTNIGTAAYVNLMLLLQFSYFGSKNLKLETVFSHVKKFNLDFFSGNHFMSITMRLYKNLVSAYESQIERFKEGATKSDPLCAPALKRFISV